MTKSERRKQRKAAAKSVEPGTIDMTSLPKPKKEKPVVAPINDAEAKTKKLTLAIKQINDTYGPGTIYTLDSKDAVLKIERWSTGIEDLDNILGGGIPKGRVLEVFGPESAGKTTLAYHLMAQCDAAMDIPIEGTFDAQRAKVFGNRKGQLFVSRAKNGEQALKEGFIFTEAEGDVVVIDSVPSMITKKEFEESDFEKEGQRGRIAAMLSSKLPKITAKAEETGTTWIFVNQLRDEQGAMLFGPQTKTPGGRALKHYCSLRLQVNRTAWIKIPNKSASNSAKELIVGFIMKVKVVKSKVNNPLGECEIPCFFDRGFVSFDSVQDIRKELMTASKNLGPKKKIEGVDEDEESDE